MFWQGRGDQDESAHRSLVFFPRKGNYNFTIRHGMRIDDLKGVYDIGINYPGVEQINLESWVKTSLQMGRMKLSMSFSRKFSSV